MINLEQIVPDHNDAVLGYELAWAANRELTLRNNRVIESARTIAGILSCPPKASPDQIDNAFIQAAHDRDSHTDKFNNFVELAAALMPDRSLFEDSSITFSIEPRYSGPSHL